MLFGRSELITALLSDTADGFSLLVGDSGTGKSSLLVEVQARSDGCVATRPVQLNFAPGSLQAALLESLGAALALMTTDQSHASRIGTLVVEATKRVRDTRLADLRSAVGRHLLGFVKAHVGDELGELIADFGRSISDTQHESLTARIVAAADPDVVDEILSFMTEVVKYAAPATLSLALDDLHRLSDDDIRRLADIVGRLPPGVLIRGSFTTSNLASRSRSDTLVIGGARRSAVAGLTALSVTEWLLAEGLDEALTLSVMGATNGYPVHVYDAIELLKVRPSAVTLNDLSPDAVTTASAQQSWRELDTASKIVAAKLAIYIDPISTPRICRLLGVDETAWKVIQMGLMDAGLMVRDSSGWFHELRRKAIWNEVLDDELRAIAAVTATTELHAQLATAEAVPSDFGEFARVAGLNAALGASTPGVTAALQASLAQIAVVAAAVELVEPTDGFGAINANTLLMYARDVYGLSGDGVTALDELVTAGLMHVASNAEAAVAVPTWHSAEALQVVAGRAAVELGRMPIYRLASAVFNTEFRPRLGDFDSAQYGVGTSSLLDGTRQVTSFHHREKNGTIRLGGLNPGLFVRATYGTVPLCIAVAFDTIQQRTHASAALNDLHLKLWDEPLTVTNVVELPTAMVPSLRFVRAVTWLRGRSFNDATLDPPDAHRTIPLEEELRVRLAIRQLVRDRLTPHERLVYNLETSTGYGYIDSPQMQGIVEIHGGSTIIELEPDTALLPITPYIQLRLSNQLGLQPNESIGTTQIRSGGWGKDPVTSEIVSLHRQAAACNRDQTRHVVDLTETNLAAVITAVFEQRLTDARDLLRALPEMGLSEPAPSITYIVLVLAEPTPGWVAGAHSSIYSATVANPGGEHQVRVAVRPATPGERHPAEDVIASVFNIDTTGASTMNANALYQLPKLLGFARDEVSFRHPKE